jgi:ketosteroid isomerase-like protein
MDEHPSVAMYRKVLERFQQGDHDAFFDSLADDVVWHQIGGTTLNGKQAVVESMSMMREVAFNVDLHDVVGNPEHVVGLVEATVGVGDESFTYRTAEIAHVNEEGKVTERWAFSDDTQRITDFFDSLAGPE